MAHLTPPFPALGLIETYTPPQLIPVGSVRHESPWTAKSVIYRRSARWEGSVVLRRQARIQEQAAAQERGATVELFDPALLNQLADGQDTFDLQLPLPTVQFRGYMFSENAAVDAARGQVKAKLAAAAGHTDWGLERGRFVGMGIRYYQLVDAMLEGSIYTLYFTPGIEPTVNTGMSSLYPDATVGAVPRIRARLTSLSLASTQRRTGIEGSHSFQWQEALE